jgi:hypothetical protein
MASNSVTASFEIRRSDADFSTLYRSGGYRPEEAIFTIEEGSDGWKKLKNG